MDIEKLKLLVNNGFKMENELFEQLYNAIDMAKSRMEEKIVQAKNSMEEDAKIITKMGWKKYFRYLQNNTLLSIIFT